jgi:ADP-heptose:LPS heptosyltransferase
MPSRTHLLLIYPDFLGDFLLFFPFMASLAPLFEQQFDEVTWLCHPAVMPLALAYRDQWPANLRVVPCQFDQTSLSLKGLLKLPVKLKQARQFLRQHNLPLHYTQVASPSFMPWLANGVLASVKSHRKLSRSVQNRHYCRLQRWLNTELYTPANFDQFVVYQHLAFFQQLFQQTLSLPQAVSPPVLPAPAVTPGQTYVVLVPDSAATSKEWPAARFACLAQQILTETPHDVVLLGVRDSTRQTLDTLLPAHPRLNNLMGKTTPLEVLAWVQKAQAVVCNDSFALHAAVSMHTPVVCVTNGGYYGRYWPYPDALVNTDRHFYIVTADGVRDLATIPVDSVWYRLAPMLSAELQQAV